MKVQKLVFALVASFIWCGASHASVPRTQIVELLDKEYTAIQTPETWSAFLEKNREAFPALTDEKSLDAVNVLKEEIEVKGETFTLGSGYRQAYIKAKPERVKTLLSRPDLFQYLYGLDGETAPASDLQTGGVLPTTFEARISKKLPSILPDQEYVLKYTANQKGDVWFQRVTLVTDKTDFALRETLVVVQPYKDGVMFREIGKVYPLLWTIRAMGPTLRTVMKTELAKISRAFKCAAESNDTITKTLAQDCWAKATK